MKDDTRQPEAGKPAGPAVPGARRRYARPLLTEYGSISRLTRTNGSTAQEFGVPRMKKQCL